MAVVIETTLGDITVDLYLQQRPQTCRNFLKLCKMKYYNFNLFHSIRSGFIAQTGDPTGEGSGGESIWGVLEGPKKRFFSGEKRPKIRHSEVGLLSMVCTDDMMVGSQFFFTLAPDLDSLDETHCVIGEVTEGHEVLTKLNEVICDETHRPYRDVRITHTVVLEDPFVDPPGLRAPSRSPSPNPERLKGGRIAPDEDIDETEGKSAAEIQEMIEEKEAKARATILEIVGDLPDADIAPPENVLFVCKLNPVTTDDDLEIIFSRFGNIVSCEVIRDKKTGNSLQYAFIEFDNKKSCEDAYFKMDNVLIDDRRIHVDFSQSVSKMRYLGKGRGVQYLNDDTSEFSTNLKEKSERRSSQEKDRNRYKDNDQSNSRNNYDDRKIHRNDNYNDRKTMHDRHSNNKSQRGRSRSRSRLDSSRSSHKDADRKESRRNKSEDTGYSKNSHNDTENSYKSNSSYNDRKRMENISPSRRNIQYEQRKRYSSVDKSDNSNVSHGKSKKRENSSSPKRNKTEVYGKHYSNEQNKEKTQKCRDKSPSDASRRRESSYLNQKRHKSQKDRNEPKTPSPVLDSNRKSKKTKEEESKVNLKRNSKVSKKRRKVSTSSSDSSSESSSSTDSSSSSSSDSDTRKKIKRRKRKPSSSSSSSTSSSSSSSSDTSSNSSTSSESEDKSRKRKKKLQAKKATKKSNK